jgi:hypothetical protein
MSHDRVRQALKTNPTRANNHHLSLLNTLTPRCIDPYYLIAPAARSSAIFSRE